MLKKLGAVCLAAVLLLTGCSLRPQENGSKVQSISRPAVESAELQFTHPAAGDTVAVFDTSAGVFRAVLFPEKAPQACDNFIGLVQQGYYNGLTVSRVENQFVVEAGQGADGKGSTIWKGSRYPVEASDSLHHYAGALCMGVDASGACASVFYVVESLPGEQSVTQELVDQMIIKLRIVRFLRTPEYNDLFSGDPVWVTESLGGMGIDGRTLVTKTCFRYLHTLYNLGPAPEPNLTVLWADKLPENWKKFCAKVSIDTSAIQYENDDLMRVDYGDDYGIACCVSPMKIGKQMQFFGARANLAKCLLYAINGGRDERTGVQVAPKFEPITSEYLDYNEVMEKYEQMMRWLAKVYVNALKIIHYMHDKYDYEAYEMALHDGDVQRIRATGIAGLSIVADSLAAIRDCKVKVIRDERGLAVDFEREGEYVPYGNNDDRTDAIAVEITEKFMNYLRQHETYRNAVATQSILTITSNVVYGKKTGTTPDGRQGGTPFAPGANPMNGRDVKGAVAALASVAKLPFHHAHDGISYTFAISPATLGKERDIQVSNLVGLLDGYFTPDGGQHLNVNVFDKDLLVDAMEHPEKYPQLTIRVSGYAVNFVKLTREQQLDVISRTINHSL